MLAKSEYRLDLKQTIFAAYPAEQERRPAGRRTDERRRQRLIGGTACDSVHGDVGKTRLGPSIYALATFITTNTERNPLA